MLLLDIFKPANSSSELEYLTAASGIAELK